MALLSDENAERKARHRRGEEDFDAGSSEHPAAFGKYLLMGKVARGGMAEVFRARAVSGVPPALLAIKCMRSRLAKESRFVEMFIREGKLAMLLDHGSIVRTYDVGSVDGRYFITMDYIAGKDLNQILRRCQETGRRIPIPHALYVGLCCAEALHYAHTLATQQGRPLNIVNRDVSPANVRLSYSGEVKLLDFGIAQAVLQVTSEIGVLKGKFSYMSPEQIRGLPLDRRTDIFSLGIVLHEMLTCERLFRDESEFVLMEMVRRAEVKPPSAFNPRIPPEVDAVLQRCLERDLENRYQDAKQVAEALSRLLQSYQFTAGELGEFVRGLFPADYRKDEEVTAACLTPRAVVADGARRGSIRRDTERVRSYPPRRCPSSRPHSPVRMGTALIWAIAILLLIAGVLILAIALA